MQPLIYSAQAALDGVGWRRGGREVTYFENGVTRRDREKGSHSTMSFVWTCEHDSDLLYFAMCYPYTFSKLRRCGAPPRALSAQLPGTGDPYSRARALPPAPRQLPRLAGRRPVARAARPARAAVHHARGERVRLSLGDRSRGDGRADWRAAGRLRLCARPSRREQRVVDDARCAATRPHRRRPVVRRARTRPWASRTAFRTLGHAARRTRCAASRLLLLAVVAARPHRAARRAATWLSRERGSPRALAPSLPCLGRSGHGPSRPASLCPRPRQRSCGGSRPAGRAPRETSSDDRTVLAAG